jgi:hypothetical protein
MAMSKEQRNAYMREWKKKNREKVSVQIKKYREANQEKIKAYHKEWRDGNRERLNEQQREKYKENPQAFKQRTDRYRETHQAEVKEARLRYNRENREKRSAYERNKRQADPVYKFRKSFISLISSYLRKHGYKGGKRTWEVVGCDFGAFLEYIMSQFEKGMTLENYGHKDGCWNIDHIIPICTAETDDDLERLNHYSNLRPMWASENYKKSKKTN